MLNLMKLTTIAVCVVMLC